MIIYRYGDIMIYTKLTRRAMNVMYEAHQGQVDKAGVPYIFHPIHVAEQMLDEKTTIVALLHDVVEDSDINLGQLSYFGDDVIEALSLLTHSKDVDYFDYIRKLSMNSIARRVKLADLRHNSDLKRLPYVTEKDIKRRNKYLRAIDYLESIESEFSSISRNQKERKFV